MKSTLVIGSLELHIQTGQPAAATQAVDGIHIELRRTQCQVWSDTECGQTYTYDATRADGHSHLSQMPDLDVVFRHLAEQHAAHRSDAIGAFLQPAVLAMESSIAARDGSSVYFIGAGGQIKIGWSRKVATRLAQLQTGSANQLKLLATVPGGRGLEQSLHKQFHHLRLAGEWFLAAPELLDHIAGRVRTGEV